MTTTENTEGHIVAEYVEIPPPVPVDDLVDALETFRLAKAQLAKLKEEAAQWEGVRDAARRRIEERLGDAEVGTVDDRTVVTWKHRKVSRVDSTRVRELIGDDSLRSMGFLKDTVERRFEVTD